MGRCEEFSAKPRETESGSEIVTLRLQQDPQTHKCRRFEHTEPHWDKVLRRTQHRGFTDGTARAMRKRVAPGEEVTHEKEVTVGRRSVGLSTAPGRKSLKPRAITIENQRKQDHHHTRSNISMKLTA